MFTFIRCFIGLATFLALPALAEPPTSDSARPRAGQPVITPVPSVSVALTHMSGAPMSVRALQEKGLDPAGDRNVDLVTYATTEAYPSGTQFKLTVQTAGPTYLYAISSDELNRTTRLFPATQSTDNSPLVAAQSVTRLPADNRSFTLPQQPGSAYVLVLVADKALDVDALVAKLRTTPGDFKKKVYTLLGNDLIAPTAIRYDPAQAASAVFGTPAGSIVPMLVAVRHR